MELNYRADWPKDSRRKTYHSKENDARYALIVLAVVAGVFILLIK